MVGLAVLALVNAALAGPIPGDAGPQLQVCNSAWASEQTWDGPCPDGSMRLGEGGCSGSSQCLKATKWPYTGGGVPLVVEQCPSAISGPWAFAFNPGNETLVMRDDTGVCVNVADYGTSPGDQVWLFACSASDCKDNCAWDRSATSLQNSGLCLDAGLPGRPALEETCAPGSPSASLPFCDPSKPEEERIADLLSRLSLEQKVQQWIIPTGQFRYNASLNVKGWLWDLTCMRGIAGRPQPEANVTVFPHAIALGATFDLPLVTRVGQVTAAEARALRNINYNATLGTRWEGVSCDGGPLANTAVQPQWGRISETYGEDPFHAGIMAATGTAALTNRTLTPATASAPAREWIQMSTVTRHYMGFHGATDLPNSGEEQINAFSLYDQQFPPYQLAQEYAEGIMCAMSAFNITFDNNDTNTGMIPSCYSPIFHRELRETWGWDGFVQTDCCDSISEAVRGHHYFANITEAVLQAALVGVQGSYSPYDPGITKAMTELVLNGTLPEKTLDDLISVTLRTRFRLGEFDTANPAMPFPAGNYPAALLDSEEHMALAREAAAASMVLLKNDGGRLPLSAAAAKRIAVVGPFGDCNQTGGGYGGHDRDKPLECSYSHSYAGQMSRVTTFLHGITTAAPGSSVAYEPGTSILSECGPGVCPGSIQAAVDLAKTSDVVVVALGLSALIEAEGRDRTSLTLPPIQQQLLEEVSAAVGASKVVLVLNNAGGVDFNESHAGAVVAAWYGGEEAGSGLADVLFGKTSPSGKLPLTWYVADYLNVTGPTADFRMGSGAGRTYRYVRSPSYVKYGFGLGLSYTTFNFSGLKLTPTATHGLNASVTVTNTGSAHGCEVAQFYVTPPFPPAGSLQRNTALGAFDKVCLEPGQSARVTSSISDYALTQTALDGTRSVVHGTYTVWGSGHLPHDARGSQTSNEVSATVVL